jgi:hypothetical protein
MVTVIITYLMRFVMVTPRANHCCLRESIRNLRFEKIMERFGMVFLHDFDVQSCKLGEIGLKDPAELMDLSGCTVKHPHTSRNQPTRPLQLSDGQDEEDFPWGRALSWQRIQDLLRTECCSFLRPLEFTHGLEEDGAYQKLFKVFTRDLWLSIGSHVVESNRLPKPRSLEGAIRTWTPQRIEQILGKDRCHFLPSTHGLVGKYPKNAHTTSFMDMRPIFFPGLDVNIPKDCIWNSYTHPGAYIHIYHGYLEHWSDVDIQKLNEYLDGIFSNLQCLPLSKPPDKSRTVIWSAVGGKIQFVTNPSFYRIEEVGGQANDQGVGPVRPQTSSRQLQARIQGVHGGFGVKLSQTRVRTKSLKTRNKRKPPLNQKQGQSHGYQ